MLERTDVAQQGFEKMMGGPTPPPVTPPGVWAVYTPVRYEDDPYVIFATEAEAKEYCANQGAWRVYEYWPFGEYWQVDDD